MDRFDSCQLFCDTNLNAMRFLHLFGITSTPATLLPLEIDLLMRRARLEGKNGKA